MALLKSSGLTLSHGIMRGEERGPVRALPDQPPLLSVGGQITVQPRKLQEIGFELGRVRHGRAFLERGGETPIA
jgi:hypothetical protein